MKSLAGKLSLAAGLLGGAGGLAVSLSASFQRQDFVALSCGCETLFILAMALLPATVGAILAITGAVVSIFRQRVGGILLLGGGGVAGLGWIFAIGNVVWGGSPISVGIGLGYVVVDFLWWEAIIVAAGLISIPTTRKALIRFRKEGWLP